MDSSGGKIGRAAAAAGGRAASRPLETMLLNLIEGSAVHRDACYLASVYGTELHEAMERAIKLQADILRHLQKDGRVTLRGGPPFDQLKVAEGCE